MLSRSQQLPVCICALKTHTPSQPTNQPTDSPRSTPPPPTRCSCVPSWWSKEAGLILAQVCVCVAGGACVCV